MKLSIVIPAFNEEKLLGATLAGIQSASKSFTARGWELELIVCDNNSTDCTAELARSHGASVVFEPVNQIGRARNCGASAATGDWLLFVDADSIPSPELFNDTVEAIDSGRYVFGGSTVVLDRHDFVLARIVGLWNGISRVFTYAAGSYIFCETAAFRQIGGFDHRLFASEELDLCKRLKLLARKQGKRGVILKRHPLLTSARKVDLYSRGEHLRFLARTALGWGGTLRSREACHTWYDGRR